MKYALVIGNDQYIDEKLPQLITPVEDARELAKVLGDKMIGEFDEVEQVINKTTSEIRKTISKFLRNKQHDDLVLLYFSGHGVLDSQGRLHLASNDTEIGYLTATAISASFVKDELSQCRSQRQILILDCCHSGAIEHGVKAAITEETFEGGYGRVILTASTETQLALEGNKVLSQTEYSLFTHFLLEGLKTGDADKDNDGIISLDEWYSYTYTKVISQTHKQTPQILGKRQGELFIARNSNLKKRLPAEIIQLLKNDLTSARVAAVEELSHLLQYQDAEISQLAREKLEELRKDERRAVSSAVESALNKSKQIFIFEPTSVTDTKVDDLTYQSKLNTPISDNWIIREPPMELGDRVSHTHTDLGKVGVWSICGASRRGRLHENEGVFREDEFAINTVAGWILAAVADGAGSHRLSRVGSKLAVKTAIDVMTQKVEKEAPSNPVAMFTLQETLREVWKTLYQESQTRKTEFRDLSTTLLILMFHPEKNLLGYAQIGDGLIFAQLENGRIALLNQAESVEYSGETYFVQSHKIDGLLSKCHILEDTEPIKYLFVITDGISDDLYPLQDRLPSFIKSIPPLTGIEDPTNELLEMINYDRPGSFDDRTLVVIYKRHNVSTQMQLPQKTSLILAETPFEQKRPIFEKLKSTSVAKFPNKLTLSNGMEFMRVPAGMFLMGEGNGQHSPDIPYDYWMARFPITNDLYNAYAKSKAIKHPVDGWKKKKDHPVVHVKWTDAIDYCKWLNNLLKAELPSGLVLRLPTEAEWEKAARWFPSPRGVGAGGGGEALEYPWGNTFDKNKCNTREGGKGSTTPVGLYSPQGESPYGCADMSGNVWEWTHSLFKPYPYKAQDGREDEKASGARVLRGGSFYRDNWFARCASRDDQVIDSFLTNVGFRVVASHVLS